MMTKLLLLKHISSLPDTALAKEIYLLQRENSNDGLVMECAEFIELLDLGDPDNFTKRMV